MLGNFHLTCDDLFSDDANVVNHDQQLKKNKSTPLSKAMFIITESMLSTILRVNLKQLSEYLLKHVFTCEKNQDEKLPTIAMLMYKIKFMELIQSLWMTYRKSGVDELQLLPELQNIDRKLWPQEVLLLVEELQTSLFGNQASPPLPRTGQTYLSFVDGCLHTFQKRHDQFQSSLADEISHLPYYNDQIQQALIQLIEKELLPIEMEINCHIELIHYAYKDALYQRQYADQISTEERTIIIDQLCRLKFKEEKLQSQINLFNDMRSMDLSQYSLANSPLIKCVRNPNLQQQLNDQVKIFMEKTKIKQFNPYIESLKREQQEYENRFNQILDDFWYIKKTTPIRETIEQRVTNIFERLACIHAYKKRLLQNQLSKN